MYAEPFSQGNAVTEIKATRHNHFKQKVKHRFRLPDTLSHIFISIYLDQETGAICKFHRIIRRPLTYRNNNIFV